MMKVHFGLAKSLLLAGMMTLATLANAQEGGEESKSTEADNTPTPAAPAPAAPAAAAPKPGGEPGKKTEASADAKDAPRDSPYDRKIFKEKRVLTYDDIREADVFFEKRIWRIIDVREKLNKPFVYPKQPFLSIIMDAAKNKEVTLYSTADDEFKVKLTADEVSGMGASTDTVITYDPETYEEKLVIARNELNPEDIKRFRLKEVWFFDKESSTLQARILGIAPIKEVKDDKGNFRFEQPMFWAYYPTLRQILARHEAFNTLNDASRMTWEDIFEMRYFSSYIMKESNVYDRRVQDYKQGIDILLEAENIKNTIFNFEHDLWTY